MNPRCRHCRTDIVQRDDGVWIHKGSRLAYCSFPGLDKATPDTAQEDTP